jgi:hypothetical protein
MKRGSFRAAGFAATAFFVCLLLTGPAPAARAFQIPSDDPASLTQDEEDRVRDAQDASERIGVYLELAGERLERFNAMRAAPPDPGDPAYRGETLSRLLSQYISLDDELKHWIDDQYTTDHDMRRGLRALLTQAPQQLAVLTQASQTPDRFGADYKQDLADAVTDMNDTLNGATKALAEQEKKYGALKRQEQQDAKAAKIAAQEQKKQEKEDRKLRKKAKQQQGVPEDEDQQN